MMSVCKIVDIYCISMTLNKVMDPFKCVCGFAVFTRVKITILCYNRNLVQKETE